MLHSKLDKILALHKEYVESNGEKGERADLSDADLSDANLRNANLTGANLTRADLDFSAWPLWCGSLYVHADKRIAAQIAYHFCALQCKDADFVKARNAIIDFANQFHRAGECGKLEKTGRPEDDSEKTV